ncbi:MULTISPECIES: hypothetical protein [Bacteroides]|jgi:hypothetical protein|uniref:Possible heat shock protein DnaJ n=1 Tax=Bacteroides graminisolvens DSM 19988 = JCM 15093 TaxID=1121097 RepID=A0A069DBY7_9BACE|nr:MULTISPECIES: hypothetical protein [Bacteroides]GAK37824.1 possible heat shock protein DnaJ [Bacteroides graminisolvens DSM 19988 = JCM 15093]DAX32085.1 MAG TPA: hypothetical protein [Caudoviricetes sp.]
MATCKLNAEQLANLATNFAGVVLVYKSTNKDGVETRTAQHFFGAEYEPADKSQDEVFRVWKNVVATFWAVKQKETDLRADNDGIRSKLRASTPTEIIFQTKNGERIKRYELEESVWQKIGLVPTKKDLERTARDYKKAIHAATKASFDALGFRVELPKEAEKPIEKVTETEAKKPATKHQQATQAAA